MEGIFDGDIFERLPIRCDSCKTPAAWEVYNRKIKKDQVFCKEHVPPAGTPRIGKYRKIQLGWCWLEDLSDSRLPPPGK